MVEVVYNPDIFKVGDLASAMRVILTNEGEGATTEWRWQNETPYVTDLIGQSLTIRENSIVIDYGCGIGRLAKELIARYGCRVLGVDISPNMRALAVLYIESDRFFACSPDVLDGMIDRGWAFDAAISIWVLQHCAHPGVDVSRIRRALRPDGGLFVLNTNRRCVPTVSHGWVDDGIDIKSLLGTEFEIQTRGQPPADKVGVPVASAAFWASYRHRPTNSAGAGHP